MNTNVPQTEAQTVMDELGLSDNAYERALDGLSFADLKEECMRQYHLSGEMLQKYALTDSKLSETRKYNNELRRSNTLLNNACAFAQRKLDATAIQLQSVKVMIDLSENYTHAMKRTVFAMIKEITLNAFHDLGEISIGLRDEINDNEGRKVTAGRDWSDIPF